MYFFWNKEVTSLPRVHRWTKCGRNNTVERGGWDCRIGWLTAAGGWCAAAVRVTAAVQPPTPGRLPLGLGLAVWDSGRTPSAAWEVGTGKTWSAWDGGRLGARVASYDIRPSGILTGRGPWTVLCRCWAWTSVLLNFRVEWVLRVPWMNTRLDPNLLRVFSFVTRWSCSGNRPRAKRVRVRVFWVTGFGLGFYAQSYMEEALRTELLGSQRWVGKGERLATAHLLVANQGSLTAPLPLII
jgi:hypothetical protein